jgi:Transmembrane domain of unknown function (DUF3566)
LATSTRWVLCPCRLATPTLLRVDKGVPQASNRVGSRAGGGGVAKPPGSKGTTKSTGVGTTRPGPVDPRTEDPSSPAGISRGGKTVWRRPGALTPRTAKHRETASLDMPIDFSVSLPLAPAPAEPAVAKADDTIADVVIEAEPIALAPTVEVLAPTALAPTRLPTELLPTELVPTDLRTEPVPTPILYDEAATIDDVTKIGPILDKRPLLKPVHFRRAPKPRVRRVTRVVRHVDTWSVFKVALVFNVFFYAVAMIAGVLLWQVAYATGTIDNVEKFFEGFGWETFNFNGGQIFHNAWIAGVFVAVGLTGLAVLLATLFNLITDLVGGIRLSVLEEEVHTRAERGTEPAVVEPAPVLFDESEHADTVMIDASPIEPTDDSIVG